MKEKEILAGNKLIAEFMEIKAERFEINEYSHGFNVFKNPSIHSLCWPHFSAHGTEDGAMNEFYHKAKYHSSFDWLMSVVEKIESLGYTVNIRNQTCNIFNNPFGGIKCDIVDFSDTKIHAAYQAVIQFITWYNQNK